MLPSLQFMTQRRAEPSNSPQCPHCTHRRKPPHHLILIIPHKNSQYHLAERQGPVVRRLVNEHVIQYIDRKRGNDARDPPLGVQGTDYHDGREEGIEKIGAGERHEPGEGVEGGDDREERAHEEDGGDAAECHFVL